jgi:hypothetical protein
MRAAGFAAASRIAALTGAALLAPGAASAGSVYLDVAGIAGENGTPGHPDAMIVESLAIAPDQLTIVKPVDSASTAIQAAFGHGAVLTGADALFYDAIPADPPDAALHFSDLLVSSSQTLSGSDQPEEQDVFSAVTPDLLYLEIPGVTGDSSTPGHAGVMALRSFSTDGTSFTVVKPVDQASLEIEAAVVAATVFPSASLLLYDTSSPEGAPGGMLVFERVLVSSSVSVPGGGEIPLEADTFSFVSIQAPEPSADALGAASLVVVGLRARSRRSSPTAV